jgi:hypothetical protein
MFGGRPGEHADAGQATQAINEEMIASDSQLCGGHDTDFMTQIRADFIDCSLPSNSLSGSCVTGEQNEPDNCGFSTNLRGLCGYCASGSQNATDSCCTGSNAAGRCTGVTIPAYPSLPPLIVSTTAPTATPTGSGNGTASGGAGNNGLGGGALAGVVIGSVAAAALLLALLLLFCICLRKRRGSQQGSLFNQPSPQRVAPSMAFAPRNDQPVPGGRVARMTALEGTSSSDAPRENPVLAAERGRTLGVSDTDPYGDSPESRGAGPHPATAKRDGSLSSNSILGVLEGSPTSNGNGRFSSPDGVASGQSEQLPFFKDYYSQDEIHPGDVVATLWAYQPRAGDEFELERGDMLKVAGIWDDGWATGVRISDRAEDYDGKHKAQRDSGVSSGSGRREQSPTTVGATKAFPVSACAAGVAVEAANVSDSSSASACPSTGERRSKAIFRPRAGPAAGRGHRSGGSRLVTCLGPDVLMTVFRLLFALVSLPSSLRSRNPPPRTTAPALSPTSAGRCLPAALVHISGRGSHPAAVPASFLRDVASPSRASLASIFPPLSLPLSRLFDYTHAAAFGRGLYHFCLILDTGAPGCGRLACLSYLGSGGLTACGG